MGWQGVGYEACSLWRALVLIQPQGVCGGVVNGWLRGCGYGVWGLSPLGALALTQPWDRSGAGDIPGYWFQSGPISGSLPPAALPVHGREPGALAPCRFSCGA